MAYPDRAAGLPRRGNPDLLRGSPHRAIQDEHRVKLQGALDVLRIRWRIAARRCARAVECKAETQREIGPKSISPSRGAARAPAAVVLATDVRRAAPSCPLTICTNTSPGKATPRQLGVGAPYNPLISDLVLENLPVEVVHRRAACAAASPADILWNPLIFAGCPSWPPASTRRSTHSA